MEAWSAEHSKMVTAALSHALAGRWVGTLPAGARDGVVCWRAQASNTHAECFGWRERSSEIGVADPGLYELVLGIWPRGAARMELRVDGRAALALPADRRFPPPGVGGGGASEEIVGLTTTTVVSLPAQAMLSVAVEGAAPSSRCLIGLRRL